METRRFVALGYTALATASWGVIPLLVRRSQAYGPVHPWVEAFVVLATPAVACLPLSLRAFARLRRRRAPAGVWLLLGWLGLAEALNVVLLFAAYRRTSIAVASFVHDLSPVMVAAVAPIALGERASTRAKAAVAVGVAGLLLVARPWAATRQTLAGGGLALGSAACFASILLASKHLSRWLEPAGLMGARTAVAASMLYLTAPAGVFAAVPSGALGWLVVAGLGPGVAGGLLFLRGLRHVRASHAATLTLLNPVVATVLARVLLGEPLPLSTGVGGMLVLASAVLVLVDVGREQVGAEKGEVVA